MGGIILNEKKNIDLKGSKEVGGPSTSQRLKRLKTAKPKPSSLTPKPYTRGSSIDMYNNDVGKESAQNFMKQTGALKAAT